MGKEKGELLKPGGDAELLESLRKEAQFIVKEYGAPYPPVNLERVARERLGVLEIANKDSMGPIDGSVFLTKTGYVIRLNKDRSPYRQNFSLAHEIAHLLLQRAERQLQPRRYNQLIACRSLLTGNEESICDSLAADLLMPEQAFTTALDKHGLSVSSLPTLSDLFMASIPAVAMRIAEVAWERCVVVVSQYFGRPSNLVPKLRIKWSAQSSVKDKDGAQYFVPRHKSIPDNSSIAQAYNDNVPIRGFEELSLGSLKGRFCVESQAFGSRPHRYVISFVFPNRENIHFH